MITAREAEDDDTLGDLAVDLTPMLDILFMLLVFLVLTANVLQHAVDVSLPDGESVAQARGEAEALVLTLHPGDGGWQIDEQTFTAWDDARAFLAARLDSDPAAQRVVIAGDRAAPLQALASALAFLRARGVTDINLLMEQD